MKIAIIGTGYVGLPTGIGLAELGFDVFCIDKDENKIKDLQSGKATLYEDNLQELLTKNLNKLTFTTSMQKGVSGADVVMIAVGTPPHPVTLEADMQYIHAAAKELALYLDKYTVIVDKSTVPVGTGDDVEDIIRTVNPNAEFDVVSVPEFLREGYALYDFFNPDRIVVGANTEKAKQVITKMYEHFADKTEMLFVSRRSAEVIKYASNAFLAIKIHYINEIANFCEQADADVTEVAKGMGLDTRIGNKFLNPGPGYGGSCFPKDTMAMAYMGRQYGVDLSLVNAAIKGNTDRKKQMADRIIDIVKDIQNPTIAVLGLAFKNNTDDCRLSPAVEIIEELLNHNVNIVAYDCQAMENAKDILQDKISYANNMYDCVKDADCLAILTEWKEFSDIDLAKVKSLMKNHNIFDCRNMLDETKAINQGFSYQKIGKIK